ncbi:MAG TPA: NAD(P)/FAD-dependent oxidoreductase [Candidatus Limnocylindrales bacterium]
MTAEAWDAIVVGGGHNGLACAAYLGRAGMRTLVLERRAVVGGAAVTESPWPGYRVSTLSYVVSLLLPEVVRELDLARHGYQVWEMSPDYFVPFPDGRHLMVWSDAERNAREFGRFSGHDARAYAAFDDYLSRMAYLLRPLLTTTPPRVGSRRPADLTGQAGLAWRFRGLGAKGVGELVRLMTQSTADMLDDWFESDEVKTALCSQGAIGAWAGPYTPGTAYVLLHHWMGEVNGHLGAWGVVRGGMGTVSEALAAAARERGVEIRTDAPVARVLVEGSRAVGAVLASGEELRAPVVVSAIHPQTTLLELVESSALPNDVVAAARRFRSRSGTVKINLAVGELPNFTAYPGTSPGPQHSGTIELCHSMAYLERAWDDAKDGRPSARPYSEVVIPTIYDDSIAPPGKHILHCFAQYVPASWAEPGHETEVEAFADRVVAELTSLAPNVAGSIEHRQVLGPWEMEREYGLVGGCIHHGDLSLDQLFSWRPLPGYADYRSPIEGLYLCSAGTHPGGGVMAAAGRNAAREIVRDHRGGFVSRFRQRLPV